MDVVKAEADEIGRLVAQEAGKALNEARADVVEGIHMAQYMFGYARMPQGQALPSEIAQKDAYMLRKPKGVVSVITPWNFPFAIPIWLITPSLLQGNTVVFKPSEDTPLVGEKLVECFERAGLPPGVLNLVQGCGDHVACLMAAQGYTGGSAPDPESAGSGARSRRRSVAPGPGHEGPDRSDRSPRSHRSRVLLRGRPGPPRPKNL